MPAKRYLDTTKQNPRARVRLLTGDEPGERCATFDGYVVEWFGWRDADFANAYRKMGAPEADWLVRVITPEGEAFVRLGRFYPRSAGATVSAEIGPTVGRAFYRRRTHDETVLPLEKDAKFELTSFIGSFINDGARSAGSFLV